MAILKLFAVNENKAVLGFTSCTMGVLTFAFSVSLAMAAAQDPCDVFRTMSCPIAEVNIMDNKNTTDTTECQTW